MSMTIAKHPFEPKREEVPLVHGRPRIAARFPAVLRLDGLPAPLPARTFDIGTGGVCVKTRSPFALSSLSHVELNLPKGRMTLEARGQWQHEVEREEGILSGVQFVSPRRVEVHRLWAIQQDEASKLAKLVHDNSDIAEDNLDSALEIVLLGRLRELPAGRWVYRERATDESIFIVLTGRLALEAGSQRNDRVRLEPVEAGGFFGGLPVLAGLPYFESAATETHVRLLEITRYTFRYLERSKPLLAQRIERAVMRRHLSHVSRLIGQIDDRSQG